MKMMATSDLMDATSVIACANTVAENMRIRTAGELVGECRKG